ncbi:excalibur calcium-binding domain-containing protein [Loktanella agnita]|uniref:excalibur calcium-binding domain-containing protein n=1 Tax=Loktanella agnita TaxID=287097 RepID=UPI003987E3C8
MRFYSAILAILMMATLPATGHAHGGGLNSDGCHTQRSTGSYHCHRSQTSRLTSPAPVSGAFRNCTAARAAGYRNIRRGSYGYGTHLDRDNDGIACEG